MSLMDRFSVSLDTELLAAFDQHIAARGYETRSEAVRDMIRQILTSGRSFEGDEAVTAILTVVCDHGVTGTAKRLRTCLGGHEAVVSGSLSMGVGDSREMQAIALRGMASAVQEAADAIQSMRGVTDGQLAIVPRGGG